MVESVMRGDCFMRKLPKPAIRRGTMVAAGVSCRSSGLLMPGLCYHASWGGKSARGGIEYHSNYRLLADRGLKQRPSRFRDMNGLE